jgi:hypothetical protein
MKTPNNQCVDIMGRKAYMLQDQGENEKNTRRIMKREKPAKCSRVGPKRQIIPQRGEN